MDGRTIKIVIILFILVALGLLGNKILNDTSDDDKLLVALDEATKNAIASGQYVVPEGVTYVESRDCEGTEWIKQRVCSLDNVPMDGTDGSCGKGTERWILDPNHPNYKPATGDGKCEPQERECEVPCPVPCEGDTWIEGACVRKEIVDGAIVETVLDGTAGKCGDGITVFDLDKSAPDFKPAVGKGLCVVEKGGACHVPCPVPEPPRCVEYAPGWQENDLGCVRSQSDLRPVKCGQTGTKNQYRIPLDPYNCSELTRWVDCQGPPCPINCEGSWSEWSAPKSDEPCGSQPYKERVFTITTQAAHGGYACDYPHNDKETRNSGSPLACCEETGDWAMVDGCLSDGTAKYVQTYKENKVNGCPDSAKAKFMACCYQALDWTDTTACNSIGKKTQTQTVVNCPESYKTREVDCNYVGPWNKVGGCGSDGLQYYTRSVVNGNDVTNKSENCPVDCVGYYVNPVCPRTCNGTTIQNDWVTTTYPLNGGAACPSPSTITCDPVPEECPIDCVGSWNKVGGEYTEYGSCNSGSCKKPKTVKQNWQFSITTNKQAAGRDCEASHNAIITSTVYNTTVKCCH